MANDEMDRVVPLGQLDDFRVADGDPDVRGWEVLASDGRKIGEVDELLVDTTAMKVRYLDVDVDDELVAAGQDRHVLIPIGYARLERDRDCVMVDVLASDDVRGIPAYDQGPLTRDFENSVRDSFSARSRGAGTMDTAGLDNTPGAGTGRAMAETAGGAAADRDEDRAMRAAGSEPGTEAPPRLGVSGALGADAQRISGAQGPASGAASSEVRGSTARGEGLEGSDYLHDADEDFYATEAFDEARFYGGRRRTADDVDAGRDRGDRLLDDDDNRGLRGANL